MRALKIYQHIVLKGFFTILLFVVPILYVPPASAASVMEAVEQLNNAKYDRILIYGDSIGQGMYNASSGNINGVNTYDFATNGANMNSLSLPTTKQGDMAIVNVGANDLYLSTSDFKSELKQRVQTLQAGGADVVLMGASVENYPGYTAAQKEKLNTEFNNAIKKVAAETGAKFVESGGGRASDGLHYTAAGYKNLLEKAVAAGTGSGDPITTGNQSNTNTAEAASQAAQQIQNGNITEALNSIMQQTGLSQGAAQEVITKIIDALEKGNILPSDIASVLKQLFDDKQQEQASGQEDELQQIQQPETGLCPAPSTCTAKGQCGNCAPQIRKNHQTIRAHVTSEFEQHRNWIVTTYFLENILPAMMLMSEQLTTTMMQQTQIIGTFFDAKHQLETQRLFQQMAAKAHKDYHPSESLCTIGTNVRSLAASERKSNLGQLALANRMLQRQLSNGDTLAIGGGETDRRSRLNLFIKKFCNKEDHGEGLKLLCKDGGKNKKQVNMDIDYTSAFENKLTLDIDFTKDGTGSATDDEENIFALGANLFGNTVLPTMADEILANSAHEPYDAANLYLDIRALAAKRSVAQNSFAAITALKSEGDEEVAPFLKSILSEAGINPEDIEKRLGEKPSYFAQMEVMTKDIYQNPSFYTELYDKPVNIERKGAALQAIELMQDRDIYKSLLRSEAVLATLIETMISQEHARVSRDLGNVPLTGEKFISSGGP